MVHPHPRRADPGVRSTPGSRADFGSRPDFGIIGCGRFGRLAASHLSRRGSVVVFDERPIPEIRSVPLMEACRARVVVFCVPIRALPGALKQTAPFLTPGTLVVDTASVKVRPCRWLVEIAPPSVELLGTHPLFGPDSAAEGLEGHKIAVVPLRLRRPRVAWEFLRSFGLEVIPTTPEAHDQAMAETQSLVHWLGRALDRLEAGPQSLDTMGYRKLVEVLSHVTRDSWELFVDLERYNPYSADLRVRFLRALMDLDRDVSAPVEPEPEFGPER